MRLIQIENVSIAGPLMPMPPAMSVTTSSNATVAMKDRLIDSRLARCWNTPINLHQAQFGESVSRRRGMCQSLES